MADWSLRRPGLDAAGRAAIAAILADPTFELLPLKSVEDQLQYLRWGARISITASPARGLDRTVTQAERLVEGGFRVVPHLAARMVRDRRHLAEIVARLSAAGIERVFVVGGDATEPGAYPDGLSLLRDLAEIRNPFRELGVPCYPEGHASIPEPILLAALRDKARYATYATTQLCFSPPHIRGWIAARRAEGLTLPLEIGLPGVAPVHRLIAVSAQIGVRDTGRFLAKNAGLVGRVLSPGGFKPDGLLAGLAEIAADPGAGVRTVHLYTFNQVRSTEAWRRAYLERIGAPAGAAA
jgi:methylenetetrahydrofolate reductase (NADPH)